MGGLRTDAEYLNLLTRKMFHSGFSKEIVDRKWPHFEALFYGFEPRRVAAMGDADRARLAADARIVRHRVKIRATVLNARHFVEVAAEYGSWRAWLHSTRGQSFERRARIHQPQLTHVGPNTFYYFMLEAEEAVASDKPPSVR